MSLAITEHRITTTCAELPGARELRVSVLRDDAGAALLLGIAIGFEDDEMVPMRGGLTLPASALEPLREMLEGLDVREHRYAAT